jgi:hypothetical protein
VEFVPCRCCQFRSPSPVCYRCQDAADTALAALPGYYTRLGDVLAPGGGVSDRVSGSKQPPLPARLGPLSLRGPGGIVGVLSRHEDDWRAALAWSPRPFRGSVEQTVGAVVVFLRNNWPWAVAEHPNPQTFADDVRSLVAACRYELDQRSDARPIGTCPTIGEDGETCKAMLWADPYLAEIRCWRCRTVWGRDRWLSLAAAMA